MKLARRVLALLVSFSMFAYGQGNSFTRVRYNGGSISTDVKPDNWDNKLTVSADSIILVLNDGKSLTIPPKQVTSLSYGQEAHRRVGTAVGLAVISLGVGALFALHKTKLHFIGVNYKDTDGKDQGILLQGDKNNFRAIIVALQGVTGVPVSVAEKERGEIPAGIPVQSSKPPDEQAKQTPSTPSPAAAEDSAASVAVTSNPDGADIYADDAFVGNAPATLKFKAGKHVIKAVMKGYKDWSREVQVQGGSEVHLTATLDKQD
jgi:hypothetical protein